METRDALQAAFDKVTAEQPAAEVVDTPVVETTGTDVEAKAEPKSERARDDLGRFAAERKEAEAKLAKLDPKAEAPKVEPKTPPKSWKKEFHDHWGKLDPAVQDYVAQREDEYFRGVGSYKQNAELGQQFMEAAKPYEAILRSINVTPVQAFQSLANVDYVLRTGDPATKIRMLQSVAKTYGIPLDNIQETPQVDPNTAHLQGTIQQLQQKIAQLEGSWNGYQQTSIQSEIEKFQAKPHFEELREPMAQLLNAGMAQDLNEAYDKALRLSPDLYEQTMAQQRQEAEQKRLREAAEVAAKAKASAVQVTGSPSTALAETPKGIRGALEAALDQYNR